MGLWVVQQFSIRETDRAQCLAALATIGDHIKAEHPEIDAVRTRVQWMGALPHRGITWEEHFESLTALEAAPTTQTCIDVWAAVHALTLPGTHQRTVLMDAEPSWRRAPATPPAPPTVTTVDESLAAG